MNLSQLPDSVSSQWLSVNLKWLILKILCSVYVNKQFSRQSKANVTNANSCFVSHVLGADKKWSSSQGNRVKGFCVLFFKHCMSSPVNTAWSLCLNPSFVSNLELSETPKTTDADSFGFVSSEILMFFPDFF